MMTYNEIIKRLRYILDVDDEVLLECFRLAGAVIAMDQLKQFFLVESDEQYQHCSDELFTLFLDGLITLRRGPSDKPRNAVALDNNVILKKVRIALELEARDIDNAFMLADVDISPHEISAMFRKPGTKHYAECSDHILERFFSGLSLYFRS